MFYSQVSWTADLMKVSVEETLKVPSTDMFKDCSFAYNYDITSSGSVSNGQGSISVVSNGVSLASYTSRVCKICNQNHRKAKLIRFRIRVTSIKYKKILVIDSFILYLINVLSINLPIHISGPSLVCITNKYLFQNSCNKYEALGNESILTSMMLNLYFNTTQIIDGVGLVIILKCTYLPLNNCMRTAVKHCGWNGKVYHWSTKLMLYICLVKSASI